MSCAIMKATYRRADGTCTDDDAKKRAAVELVTGTRSRKCLPVDTVRKCEVCSDRFCARHPSPQWDDISTTLLVLLKGALRLQVLVEPLDSLLERILLRVLHLRFREIALRHP